MYRFNLNVVCYLHGQEHTVETKIVAINKEISKNSVTVSPK